MYAIITNNNEKKIGKCVTMRENKMQKKCDNLRCDENRVIMKRIRRKSGSVKTSGNENGG